MKLWFKIFKRILKTTEPVVLARRPYKLHYSIAPLVTSGRIIKTYTCGIDNLCTIAIVEEEGEIKYYVNEPRPSDKVIKFYPIVMDHIAYTSPPPEKVDKEYIEGYVKNAVIEAIEGLGLDTILGPYGVNVMKYYVVRDVVGYGPIDPLMRDPLVEEISALGPRAPVEIVHREVHEQLWISTNIVFESEEELAQFVQRLAQKCGKYISVAFPILETSTPGPQKHRVALNLSDVSGRGSSFVIRKFPEAPYSIVQLIDFGTLSPLMAAYLWLIVEHLGFTLIIGSMASGKTTMLNSILSMAPPDYRITTIEDVPELRLPHPNWDPLYTRKGYSIGSSLDIDLFTLAKYALRRRGQIISIGEVRGEEIQVLVQAAATGQGSHCTFHATTIEEVFMRMTSPPLNVQPAFLTLIWSIILMRRTRLPNGKVGRRAVRIWEITGIKSGYDVFTAIKTQLAIRKAMELLSSRNSVVDLDRILLEVEKHIPGIRSAIPVEYKILFTWDPTTDEFKPDNPNEVIDKSYSLRRVMEFTGLRPRDLIEELKERIEFLQGLVDKRITNWNDIYLELRKFYVNKRFR